MKTVFAFVLIFSIAATSFAADSPLVEAAKKEKERREKIKSPSKKVTNAEVEEFIKKKKAAGEILESLPETAAVEDLKPSVSKKQLPSSESKEEDYWRSRKKDLDQRIEEAKFQLEQAKIRVLDKQLEGAPVMYDPQGRVVSQPSGDLNSRNYNSTDINYQQNLAILKQELTEAERQLNALNEELANLPEEARKAGALPGWVR